jgi:uncharacterized membrane protein
METPSSLVVLGFESSLRAQEAFLAVNRLQAEGHVTLQDAVFVAKDVDGTVHVKETMDTSPGDAALRSGMWGAVVGTLFGGPAGTVLGGVVGAGVGALAAGFTDLGIKNETLHALRDAVKPGTTALALLVSQVDDAEFLAEMHRFAGAKLLQTNLPADADAVIRAALLPMP